MGTIWVSPRTLKDKLLHDYPPRGLTLRPLLHTRPDAGAVTRSIPMESVFEVWEPGLLPAHAWAGMTDGVPFFLEMWPATEGSPGGLTVGVPLMLNTRGHLDLSLLERLARLPAAIFCSVLFLEGLPFKGDGHGVSPTDRPHPEGSIFRTPLREDALAVAEFLNHKRDENHYVVIPVVGCGWMPWIVVGPPAGPFVSWSWRFETQERAEEVAEHYSNQWGAEFCVYDGPIAGDPVARFESGARRQRRDSHPHKG